MMDQNNETQPQPPATAPATSAVPAPRTIMIEGMRVLFDETVSLQPVGLIAKRDTKYDKGG